MKTLSFFKSIKTRIANLSTKERVFFSGSVLLLGIGILGGLVTLSNRFTTEIPQSGGTYREGLVGSPRFVNPILATSDADRDLTRLVYSGLVRETENQDIVPDIASEWTISPDGKTYTFTLKPSVTFHDGKKLTSSDILFTVQKIQDPTLKSPLRIAWDGVTVTTPDASTIVFSLQKPYAGFLGQLNLGILPEHIWKSIPNTSWQTSEFNTEPIGSGPYHVTSVSRNRTGTPEQFTLRAFSKFILGKPFMSKIEIKIFANRLDAYDAFRRDDIDALAMVDSGDVDSIISHSDTMITKPLPRVFGIFLNPTKNKLLSDPTIVKALNLGTNKQALISQIFKGYGTALDGPLPRSVDTLPGDATSRQQLAKAMLDRAGWKINPETGIREKSTSSTTGTGKTKKTVQTSKQILEFTLSTANTPDLQESAQLIADQYRQLGIEVTIKVFEIGTLNENIIRGRDFEALLFGQVIKHDTDIFAFWHSTQKITPGLNITGYTNKQVDSLLESVIKESDPNKRDKIYEQITTQLTKDAPVIFLYTPDTIELVSKRIKNPVVPPITTPSDRFSLIYQWYIDTDRVWNTFNN